MVNPLKDEDLQQHGSSSTEAWHHRKGMIGTPGGSSWIPMDASGISSGFPMDFQRSSLEASRRAAKARIHFSEIGIGLLEVFPPEQGTGDAKGSDRGIP